MVLGPRPGPNTLLVWTPEAGLEIDLVTSRGQLELKTLYYRGGTELGVHATDSDGRRGWVDLELVVSRSGDVTKPALWGQLIADLFGNAVFQNQHFEWPKRWVQKDFVHVLSSESIDVESLLVPFAPVVTTSSTGVVSETETLRTLPRPTPVGRGACLLTHPGVAATVVTVTRPVGGTRRTTRTTHRSWLVEQVPTIAGMWLHSSVTAPDGSAELGERHPPAGVVGAMIPDAMATERRSVNVQLPDGTVLPFLDLRWGDHDVAFREVRDARASGPTVVYLAPNPEGAAESQNPPHRLYKK